MKKLFLMLAAIPALCLASCSKDDPSGGKNPGNDNPNTDDSRVILSEAVYYGEKLGAGYGFYSMTFEQGDNTLRLDVFGSVAADASAASISGGEYTLGSVNTPATRTFFLAENTSDEIGTLYWKNGTPVLVSGGSVTVNVAAGGYRVTVSLTAGNDQIDWVYNGKLSFENNYERAPRRPIAADRIRMSYLGPDETNTLGIARIIMQDSATPNTYLRVYITMPIPENSDAAEIPTGTFNIVNDLSGTNQIEAGYLNADNNIGGSLEYEINTMGYVSRAVLLDNGTMTITKDSEGVYTVTTNFSGEAIVAGSSSIIRDGIESDIIYSITTNWGDSYFIDESLPYSNISESINVSDIDFVKVFFDCGAYGEYGEYVLYRVIFLTESLSLWKGTNYESDGSLYVRVNEDAEEGSVISFQITSSLTNDGTALLLGTFPMYSGYDYEYFEGSVRPAIPGDSDVFGFFGGSWYMKCTKNEAGESLYSTYAGFVCDEGTLTLEGDIDGLDGDDVTVYVNAVLDGFKDKHGYLIEGEIEPVKATVANLPEAPVQRQLVPAGAVKLPLAPVAF